MSTVCNTALVQCWPGSWRCQLIDVLRELDLVLQSEWLWNPQQKPGFNSNLGPFVIWMNEWMNILFSCLVIYMMCPSGNYSDTLTYNKLLAEYVCPSSISLPHLNIKKNYHKKMCLSGQMQYYINSLLPKNHSDCHYKSHHLKWWLLVLIVCETSSKCKATGVSKTWRVAAQCWSKTQSPTTWLMRSANNVH